MTGKTPIVTAREMIKTLERAGFVIHRQSGSHVILKSPESGRRVTVPYHGGDLHKGVVHNILQQAGMNIDEFLNRL
jgi:mRNA interferase HicA